MGVAIGNGRVYIAMGGWDWTAAYDLNTGNQLWFVDTYGQTQDVALTPNELVIGGHFRVPGVSLAPSNGIQVCNPDYSPGYCAVRTKIAALSLSGFLDQNWAPSMNEDYDGVWRLLVNGPQVYAVGEFNRVNTVHQAKIARFTDSTPAPAVAVTPVSWNFGTQAVGTVGAAQTLTLTNTGNAPLNFTTAIAISGDFAQNNTCGTSLAAGANCTITVNFSPTTTGPRLGAIVLTDNANLSPQTIKLAGTGTQPMVAISPENLNFGSQQVSTTSASQPVVLTNSGNGLVNISSIATTANFIQTNN